MVGHHDKIAAAVARLQERGALLPHLRDCERNALIWHELRTMGYPEPQPTLWSIRRFFDRPQKTQNDVDVA